MLSCVPLLVLLFSQFTDVYATLMAAANTSNATAEYYYLSNDGITDKEVICGNVEACFVECLDESSCLNAIINATASNSFTFIRCAYPNGCAGTVVYGPKLEANINGGWYANVEFHFNTTKIINYNGNGWPISLSATNAEQVYITCSSCSSRSSYANPDQESSFYLENVSEIIEIDVQKTGTIGGAFIYASNANKLEIMCRSGFTSCDEVSVWPPYKQEYAFTIYCSSIRKTCEGITVHVPSYEYVNNYMQLICSRQWSHSDNINYDYDWDDMCNIEWQCHHISENTTVSNTVYQAILGGYGCDTNVCCPWRDGSDITDMVLNATKFYRKELDQCVTPLKTRYRYNDFADLDDYSKITCAQGTDCRIECTHDTGFYECRGLTIYAGLADNLFITCTYKASCTGMYVAEGPKKSAEIICQNAYFDGSWEHCSEAVFDLSDTEDVYLLCNNTIAVSDSSNAWKAACFETSLIADGATTATVVCHGSKYNCYDASFYFTNVLGEATVIPTGVQPLSSAAVYAMGSNKLSLNCSHDTACDGFAVYPPYHKEYAFLMWCPMDSGDGGCSVSIKIQNSTQYVTNYMALVCNNSGYSHGDGYLPTLDRTTCGISFHCADIQPYPPSTVTTRLNWDYYGEYWWCVDSDGRWGYVGTAAEYNGLCCPWIEQSYMAEHTMRPTPQPTVDTDVPTAIPSKMPTPPTTTTTSTPTSSTASPTSTSATSTTNTDPNDSGGNDGYVNKFMLFVANFMSITAIMLCN